MSHLERPTHRRIRSEIYAEEYPEEVDSRSFLTWTTLRGLGLRGTHSGRTPAIINSSLFNDLKL